MGKKHEKAFHLDMAFEEALGRIARTNPKEVVEPAKAMKKRKMPLTASEDDKSETRKAPPTFQR
jgi:hypothetical protein